MLKKEDSQMDTYYQPRHHQQNVSHIGWEKCLFMLPTIEVLKLGRQRKDFANPASFLASGRDLKNHNQRKPQ